MYERDGGSSAVEESHDSRFAHTHRTSKVMSG